MTIRLRRNNQITIPATVIREAGLKVGDMLDVKVEDDAIVIKAMTDAQKFLSLSGFLGGIYNDYDHEAEMKDAWAD